jgi:hypothetical protein
MLALGRERARDDLVGCVVAAHGVDGQHRTGRSAAAAGNAGSGVR